MENFMEKINYLAYIPPFTFSKEIKKPNKQQMNKELCGVGKITFSKVVMPFERICQHWNSYFTLE